MQANTRRFGRARAAALLGAVVYLASPWAAAKEIVVAGRDSAAIDAAIASAEADDVVRLPAGVYSLAHPVKLRSRVSLQGDPAAGATVLRYDASQPGAMVSIERSQDLRLANFTLDGHGNPSALHGIAASHSSGLTIENVAVRDLVKGKSFGPIGVYFSGAVTDSAIHNCTFDAIGVGADFGCGIRMEWGSSRNRAIGNTIRRTGRGGVFGSDGSTDLVIAGNRVSGSGGVGLGVEVWKDCDRALIEDNRVDHWISLDKSPGSAVRRNVVAASDGPTKFIGIELVNAHDCVFTDNVVDAGQMIGLSESNKGPKQFVYWGYNRFLNIPGWAAQIQGEAGGASEQYFYRCDFIGAVAGKSKYPNDDGHGLRLNGNCRNLVFDQCRIENNARDAVQLLGDDAGVVFNYCSIVGNKGPAVAGLKKGADVEWIGCKIAGNGDNRVPEPRPLSALPALDLRAPATIRAGAPAHFTDASASPGPGAHRLWDFGDGLPATGDEASHTFAKAGQYHVTLIAWDAAGRGRRAEKTVTVEP